MAPIELSGPRPGNRDVTGDAPRVGVRRSRQSAHGAGDIPALLGVPGALPPERPVGFYKLGVKSKGVD